MAALLLGLLLFLGVHSVRIAGEGWRTATIARIGALPWKGGYSLLSIAGFALLVWGYGQARLDPVVLWSPPAAMRHVTALLMLPVFVLFVAAYVPRNAVKAKVRHPQILSVKLWAFAHLLSNGNLADVLLFGSFLVWAVLDFRAARRRDPSGQHSGPVGERAAPGTGAVATQGAMTAVTVVAGLAVYAAFVVKLHAWLIGVQPV